MSFHLTVKGEFTMTTLSTTFRQAFFATSNVIAYNPEWANGTGYYDELTNAEISEVPVGEFFRTVDPGTNRRIIGLKLDEGKNAVVFERFSQCSEPGLVLVSNLPYGFKPEGFGSSLSIEAFQNFLGKFEQVSV